jgi:hypothetical protein
MHQETLALGMAELEDETALAQPRIRQVGGGRKSAFETIAGLDEAFLRVLERHTVGSPIKQLPMINSSRTRNGQVRLMG